MFQDFSDALTMFLFLSLMAFLSFRSQLSHTRWKPAPSPWWALLTQSRHRLLLCHAFHMISSHLSVGPSDESASHAGLAAPKGLGPGLLVPGYLRPNTVPSL